MLDQPKELDRVKNKIHFMRVHELITMLEQYHPSCEVIATWEGTAAPLDVYQAADGRVIIDADSNHYKTDWQRTEQ